MGIRQLLRGTLGWNRLEAVAREIAIRYDRPVVRMTFLDAENWLSTPCVVDEDWFVKIISPRNAFVHALFTGARNLGAVTAGGEGFFERATGPVEMARHELEATRRMQEIGVNAPEPIEAFEVNGLGVVVMEYLEDFTTLDALPAEVVDEYAVDLFEALSTMHAHDLAHGDLREENVLVHDDQLFFIDATNVDESQIDDARSYDVACALGALEPYIGASAAVEAAAQFYPESDLREVTDFLPFVNLRPDHDFNPRTVRDAIDAIESDE
ncbi:RIO1 family regulatory kinase/ATPase domain-containing protein [Halanaeroarchaeum sulfurireducens]|uniref:non-specific serine/threonine protein kinase n=1 Tax=Halanaeroarchaeum sulfurireducens TaxID=1604004 RepID=A0A0F7PED1_9EURY|nr:RIO1 family regulatory kinase/ATPase [Halanaeroarchaeum sulfurireducens]AKH97653.1 serine/threonine protein kinase [Halanaeroarchaeum sulfurireducens]ALG82048.1 serine/threonine protein kinase [Halanaeroarchaeum sulfurireducens]